MSFHQKTPDAKAATLERMERLGLIEPACPSCAPFYQATDPTSVFAPRHKAKPSCKSGGHPHCTCDGCF